MNKTLVVMAGILLICGVAGAGDGEYKPPVVSPELKHMAEFTGRWEGTTKMDSPEPQSAAVEYQVTSGGSAVVETLFPGTPHEMVSVYHDTNGKLAMTHYCMLGNHPELALISDADGTMTFDAAEETRQALAGQPFMGTLVLKQDGPDQLTQTWTGNNAEGVADHSTVITLKRVK